MENKQVIALNHYDERTWQKVKEMSQSEYEYLTQQEEVLENFAQDVFASFFVAEVQKRDYQDIAFSRFANKCIVDKLMDSMEYKMLREFTEENEVNSAIVTFRFGTEYVKKLKELLAEINEIEKQEQIIAAKEQIAATEEEKREIEKQEEKLMKKANELLEKAEGEINGGRSKEVSEKIKETIEKMEAIGQWAGKGLGNACTLSLDDIMNIYQKVRYNSHLNKIVEIAGKLQHMTEQKKKSECKNIPSEVHDITLGNDLQNTIVSQILMPDFKKKFVEKSLMQRELKGREEQSKGPVIVCLDHSSSMHDGGRDIFAKAVFLNILKRCAKDNRKVLYIAFNRRVIKKVLIDKKTKQNELFHILTKNVCGGTDFEPPITKALEEIDKKDMREADIIFVTDGNCHVGDYLINQVNEKKKQKEISFFTVYIDSHENVNLRKISDKSINVKNVQDDISQGVNVLENI